LQLDELKAVITRSQAILTLTTIDNRSRSTDPTHVKTKQKQLKKEKRNLETREILEITAAMQKC